MPTVGRIVHYRTYDNERTQARCVPAMVTETHPNEFLGLFIAGPLSIHFDRNVRHDEGKDDATWHWPCVIIPAPDQEHE
jgi:hypothetical protein